MNATTGNACCCARAMKDHVAAPVKRLAVIMQRFERFSLLPTAFA
jgi:hypothetical protein